MSSIEERLARDIEAVTGGVVVTHADVEQARDRVEERIERSGRVRRRWTAVAAAATAAAVVGVGALALASDPGGDSEPTPADSAPGVALTQESVQGVWRIDNGATLVRFGSEGDVAFDTRGRITTPESEGSYSLEGDEIVVDLARTTEPDCVGELVFRASDLGQGEVRMEAADPSAVTGCGFEQAGQWVLEHVLPTSREMSRFGPPTNESFGPLERAVLPGFWLLVGGGHGVELTRDGTYSVLDDSAQVIETGRWRLAGDRLAFEADTTGCRIVLSEAQHINPGTDMLRGTLTEYGCELPWVSGDGGETMEWFQIPDRSSF